MRRSGLFAMGLALGLGACATAPVSNDLGIETVSRGQPVPGANCTVQLVEGSFDIVTPAVVPARNTRGDLRVVCNKPGYRTSEVLYRGGYAGYDGYGSRTSLGFGVGGGGGSVGYGIGLGVPIGGGASPSSMPASVLVEMNPL
jgi:hypothetical protein